MEKMAFKPRRMLKTRQLRVVLGELDVTTLASLRQKLQDQHPERAITDSDVVRHALLFTDKGTQ